MNGEEVTVVKLGGSLLGWPDWPAALSRLLNQIEGEKVLLVGGGAAVDKIRSQTDLSQDAERAHWSSLAAMSENAIRVHRHLPGAIRKSELPCRGNYWFGSENSLVIFDSRNWLKDCAARNCGWQSISWRFTSDSIALCLALEIQARHLVLAKSTAVPPGNSLSAYARAGFIDPCFPEIWQNRSQWWTNIDLQIKFANLRDQNERAKKRFFSGCLVGPD